MKKTNRFPALLLALFLLLSLPACGESKNDGHSSPDSGAINPSTPDTGDFDWHDTVFPGGEDVPRIKFGSLSDYKTLRNLVKKGGSGPDEAVAFAREKLNITLELFGDNASDRLKTAEQVETLVAETENVKILLPQNKDWMIYAFSRAGSMTIPDGKGGVLSRPPYKRCLSFGYRNEKFGSISLAVYYDDATRNRTPRQFYRYGTGNEIDMQYEYSRKYVSPEPYFTLPLSGGETLTVFKLDDESDTKGFLFTDNSEIILSYSFQNPETNKLTVPTMKEKEDVLRAFFEGAQVMTLSEAANSVK